MIGDPTPIYDVRRLGLVPLYPTYAEIREAVARLGRVVTDKLYAKYPPQRPVSA